MSDGPLELVEAPRAPGAPGDPRTRTVKQMFGASCATSRRASKIGIWLSAGPHVHCVGTLTARRGGQAGSFAEAHVFRVDDVLVVSGRVYADDLYGFDAFFAA